MQTMQAPTHPRHASFGCRAPYGFTIIELMVVVAIVAVLAALAAPSFTPLIERWRVRQSVDGLQSALYYTRSEAIKRGGNVTIRKEPSGANGCPLASGAGDWDCGWFVFVDTNNNGVQDAGEEILQRFATPPNVEVARSATSADIRFDRWGRANAPFGFSIVPKAKSTSDPSARGLCMSSGGRVKVTTDPADIPCAG
jgi:type IV fimbrial biogenesis protein FimT